MQPRNVLITGASSGLGRGLALHYARQGAVVHALARRRLQLESLAAEVGSAGGTGRVAPAVVDVVDTDALTAAIAAAEQAAGGALDLVIANAGTSEATFAQRMDWRAVKRIMDVNVVATCVTVAAALPAMVARGEGTVVAVGSLAGLRGLPLHAAYSASKASVHTFMEAVRVDLRGTSVRAITIQPGFVKTELTAKNHFHMPLLMELDDAVRVMVKGIARGDAVIAFPRTMSVFGNLMRALPRAVYEPLARRGSPLPNEEQAPADGASGKTDAR